MKTYEYGKTGWSVAFAFNNGQSVMMQREVKNK